MENSKRFRTRGYSLTKNSSDNWRKIMQCPVCKVTGGMKRCKKCGQIYCLSCALHGRGPWPKVNIQNKCPWCGKMNCSETAR